MMDNPFEYDPDDFYDEDEEEYETDIPREAQLSFEMPFEKDKSMSQPLSKNGSRLKIGDRVRIESLDHSRKVVFVAARMEEYVKNGQTYMIKDITKMHDWVVNAGGWNWGSKDLYKLGEEELPKPPEPITFDPSLLDLG